MSANSHAIPLLLALALGSAGCTPYVQSYKPAVDQEMSAAASTDWALVLPPGPSYESFNPDAPVSQWPAAKTYPTASECDRAQSQLAQGALASDLKDKLAKVEKHPFTDAEAQQVREYVSHATCISRGRNYETDLATCREIAEGSSASGSGKELAGTGAGALAGAGVGLAAGEHPLGLAIIGGGLGAIGGAAVTHGDIRRVVNQCLQLRGWTVLGAE